MEVVNVLVAVCLSNLALTIIIAQKMLHLESEIARMGSLKDKTQEDGRTRENVIEPDFIDYDGIGNQGRFVEKKKKNKKRTR